NKSTLFQPERFHDFEETFRLTIQKRIQALESLLQKSGQKTHRLSLEPEIKAVMLEMLVNNFFGAQLSYDEIRNKFTPALERVIDHIVSDTVMNKIGIPVSHLPTLTPAMARIKKDYAVFEELTSIALAPRKEGRGLWGQFKSDVPDAALRSNIRVFLAGALEATTSFAAWALFHVANDAGLQEAVFQEIRDINTYTPENLNEAKHLNWVLEETLRLTPSLYFLPRKATGDTWIETVDKRRMCIPKGTHILLDVWHANRCEDFWGVSVTGFPASEFAPQRWDGLAKHGYVPKDFLHFGFGYGARVCPGKYLGQLEVGLVVGAVVKVFKLRAVNAGINIKAGVSTKPQDGLLVDLELRK
ncbi:MAG: cytochrome P450, partial [Candidatus Omnitrophica bacterium]|nr:cytochrome P450 [Candidatus Omnitrophota bacterium]